MSHGAPEPAPTPPPADDTPWRDPDEVFGHDRRLSDVGDRRLKDVRANEPRLRFAWFKITLMVAFLVAILVFHGEVSDKAAGCYHQASGTAAPAPPRLAPGGGASGRGTRLGSPHEVQIRVERLPAPAGAPGPASP